MILPSIELKWLKPDKQISLPDIVYGRIPSQGAYYEPRWAEVEIDGRNYSLEKGLIVIDDSPDALIKSTLAHEFRHHMQYLHGVFEIYDVKLFNRNIPYNDAIIDFFTTCPYEFDALIYEMKYDHNWCNDYWLNLLINKTNNNNLYNLIWQRKKVIMI